MTADARHGRGALDRALRLYIAGSKRIVLAVSIAMLVGMVAINSLEIAGRGLFQLSFTWVQEVSIIAAMWVYFFAYGLIAKDEEYIRVDVLANLFGEAVRRRVTIAARILTIVFHAIVLWFAVETFRFLGLFRTPVLDWPESLFVLPILLGAADITITEAIYFHWTLAGRAPPRGPRIVQEAD